MLKVKQIVLKIAIQLYSLDAMSFLIRFFFILFFANIAFASVRHDNTKSSNLALVKNGNISVDIVLPDSYSKEEMEAARILSYCLRKTAKKGKVRLCNESNTESSVQIRLGVSPRAEQPSPLLRDFKNVNIYEFSANEKGVKILYPDKKNAVNAVGYFLQKYGFRFYTPLRETWDIPRYENFYIRNFYEKFKPSFESIQIYGVRDEDADIWLKLNGQNAILSNYNHNLNRIFTEESFKYYPEFKPEFSQRSAKDLKYYQPNFSAKYADNYAAQRAILSFDKNPKRKMYSLGINDSHSFDEREIKSKDINKFFRGYPDRTDSVFDFTNKSAKIIAKKYPEKFIGALSYLWTENSPSFKLEKSILPYLCADRANYFDADFKAQDFELMRKWATSGARLVGMMDYSYGASYDIPRTINDFLYEGIINGHKAGIRAYFTELPPLWQYDACKLWVCMQLLSDVNKNPAKLEKEFYKFFYKESANTVEEFFELSKQSWRERKTSVRWLKLFKKESAFELFDEEKLFAMESLLQKAKSESSDKKTLKNLEELSAAFGFTKASWKKYFLQKELLNLEIKNKDDAQNAILLLQKYENSCQEKTAKREFFKEINPYKKSNFSRRDSEDVPLAHIAKKILEFVDENALQDLNEKEYVRIAKSLKSKKYMCLFYDSFESASIDASQKIGGISDNYLSFYEVCENMEFRVSEKAKNTIEKGLLFASCENAYICKYFRAKEDLVFELSFDAKRHLSQGVEPYARIIFLDKNHKILHGKNLILLPEKDENFQRYHLIENAPEGTAFVGFSINFLYGNKEDSLYIDNLDFGVYLPRN